MPQEEGKTRVKANTLVIEFKHKKHSVPEKLIFKPKFGECPSQTY